MTRLLAFARLAVSLTDHISDRGSKGSIIPISFDADDAPTYAWSEDPLTSNPQS